MSGAAEHEVETAVEHETATDDVIATGTAAVSTITGAAVLGAALGGPEAALVGGVLLALARYLEPLLRRLVNQRRNG